MNEMMKSNDNKITGPIDVISDDLPMVQGMTAQKIQTAYMTAAKVQLPRVMEDIVDAVMRESEYAREAFFYAWGEGENHVEGPSVGLCLCVAREWGNCAVETYVVNIEDAWEFTSHFIDLERGFTISRTFRQPKQEIVYGQMDKYRKDNNRYQRGQSKSIRNVIRAAMPSWLIEQAIERAKESIRKGITEEGIATAIEKAFKILAQHGVTKDRVLAKIGRKNKHGVTMEDIIDLRTAYSAISKGEAYADAIFPPSKINHAAGAKVESPVIPIADGKEDPPETEKAPDPGTKQSVKDDLENLLAEGKKRLGKDRYEIIFAETFPEVGSVSKLNKKQKLDFLKKINVAVDELNG